MPLAVPLAQGFYLGGHTHTHTYILHTRGAHSVHMQRGQRYGTLVEGSHRDRNLGRFNICDPLLVVVIPDYTPISRCDPRLVVVIPN